MYTPHSLNAFTFICTTATHSVTHRLGTCCVLQRRQKQHIFTNSTVLPSPPPSFTRPASNRPVVLSTSGYVCHSGGRDSSISRRSLSPARLCSRNKSHLTLPHVRPVYSSVRVFTLLIAVMNGDRSIKRCLSLSQPPRSCLFPSLSFPSDARVDSLYLMYLFSL